MLKALVLLAALPASLAAAQTLKNEYQPKPQHIEMEPIGVEGDNPTPGASLLSPMRPPKYPSLIKVRTTFVPELVRSAEDVR
jgi:hypothetical protein